MRLQSLRGIARQDRSSSRVDRAQLQQKHANRKRLQCGLFADKLALTKALYVTISLCHYITMSLYHYVTMSLVSLCLFDIL